MAMHIIAKLNDELDNLLFYSQLFIPLLQFYHIRRLYFANNCKSFVDNSFSFMTKACYVGAYSQL